MTKSFPAPANTSFPAPAGGGIGNDHSLIRLHVPDALEAGADIALTATQAHYLGTVMRRSLGDRVRLFNGRDGEYVAVLSQLRRDHAAVTVGVQSLPQIAQDDLWLCFALLKRTPTALIVQKATELGVSAIMPVFTTRTSADRTNVDRLRMIAIEAAEQSERLSIPAVHPPRALNAVLAGWPPERRLVACFERSTEAPLRRRPGQPAGLLVGPEGGFTDAELDAVRACPFVEAVSLGPRILRAETAAIVGLALMQAG